MAALTRAPHHHRSWSVQAVPRQAPREPRGGRTNGPAACRYPSSRPALTVSRKRETPGASASACAPPWPWDGESRGGERQLDHRLHIMAITQISTTPPGRAYYQSKMRRRQEPPGSTAMPQRRLSDVVSSGTPHRHRGRVGLAAQWQRATTRRDLAAAGAGAAATTVTTTLGLRNKGRRRWSPI